MREAGKFHFFPLTVKGEKIEGIVKADWIWTTKTDENATKQDLLAEVFWDSGKVNFTTTGQEGNAVLAGFDKTGKIVWVWHIWCTDMPSTMTYASGAAFMDRNLGATSADPAQLKETYGLLWQWGRNVPIFGGYETEWRAENTFDEARKWTILNPAYPYQWTFSTNSVDVQGSLKAFPQPSLPEVQSAIGTTRLTLLCGEKKRLTTTLVRQVITCQRFHCGAILIQS